MEVGRCDQFGQSVGTRGFSSCILVGRGTGQEQGEEKAIRTRVDVENRLEITCSFLRMKRCFGGLVQVQHLVVDPVPFHTTFGKEVRVFDSL